MTKPRTFKSQLLWYVSTGDIKKIFRTATFHVLLQRHKLILSVQILKVQQVLNVLLIFLFYKSNVDIKFWNFELVNMIPVVGHADDRYLFFVAR